MANLEAEQRFASCVEQIFGSDAKQVAQSLDGNPCAIVTGPCNSGKTSCLMPLVEKELSNQGLDVLQFNIQYGAFSKGSWHFGIDREKGHCGQAEIASYLADFLPSTDGGCLILDDAGGNLCMEPEGAKQILQTIHERGYSVVPVIAYRHYMPGIESYRDKQIQLWSEAETEVTGYTPPTYFFQRKNLPPDLAQEFVQSFHNYVLGRTTLQPDIIAYIVSTFPNYLRILHDWTAERSREITPDFIDHLRARASYWKGRELDETEYDQVRRTLDLDYKEFFGRPTALFLA